MKSSLNHHEVARYGADTVTVTFATAITRLFSTVTHYRQQVSETAQLASQLLPQYRLEPRTMIEADALPMLLVLPLPHIHVNGSMRAVKVIWMEQIPSHAKSIQYCGLGGGPISRLV